MGAGFDIKTRAIMCNGQLVTKKLNDVFRTPGTGPYKQAQKNNTFDKVPLNKEGNWKDLLIAYLLAGVDVGNEFPAWVAYLEQLGAGATGTQGPINISLIAQARYNALTANPPLGVGMDTNTGPGGGPVHTNPGSGPNPVATIVSPCPP